MQVGTFEAKNKLSALLDRVEQGEEVVITRHGEPVAKLVPHRPTMDREQARAALDRISQRAKQLRHGFDWEEIKAMRDEGRR